MRERVSTLSAITGQLRPPPRPPGEFVRVDGTVLHVVRDGPPEGPLVVFSSGMGGAWLSWDAVVPMLADQCHVVRFDRPGLGWSQPDPRPPTLAGEAERIRALLKTLGLVEPCVLVGHSLAGAHVEAFARLFPESTAGLVLAESACAPVYEAGSHRELRLKTARVLGRAFQLMGASQFLGPGLRGLGVRTQSLRKEDTADPRHTRGAFCHGATVTAALLERVTCSDLLAELSAMRVELPFPPVALRVLAASGPKNDPELRAQWRSDQQELARIAVDAEVVEIPDSGHLIPVDRPDAVAAAVLDVLDRYDGIS